MLVITYLAGISFELTLEETLGLADFIHVYRQTLIAVLRDTEPHLERINKDEVDTWSKEP